jgi:hypothetical protein
VEWIYVAQHRDQIKGAMQKKVNVDFRFPPRCGLYLRSSGTLHSVEW